uniref:Uncharacterized protein n=1 Tax=Rhizophora mucronata TaxID=61149 RepID=A0A2P2II19_RHIMU
MSIFKNKMCQLALVNRFVSSHHKMDRQDGLLTELVKNQCLSDEIY